MLQVNFEREVYYSTLETALIEAGKERGWRAEFEDVFERSRLLVSGENHEIEEYKFTRVYLFGTPKILYPLFPIPALTVHIPDKKSRKHIYVGNDLFFDGYASERKVQDYLGSVSRRLNSN